MRGKTAIGILVLTLVAGACGAGTDPGGSTTPTSESRPSSTARLSILDPENGSVVHGSTVDVRLRLRGARVVQATSTDIEPDEGHVHLLLDGELVSMNYRLNDEIQEVHPGSHLLQVEFVASDHAPFDPRVVAVSSFEVKP